MSGFGAVYGPGGGAPRMFQYNATSGATFEAGDVVILSSGEITGSGADPAAGTILAVSAAANDSAPGYNMQNQPTIVTWRTKSVPVYMANGNIFKGKLTNGSATYVAPAAADVGASYGITKNSTTWSVDKSKTTTSARVVVDKIDTDNNEVYFRFIESFTVEI